MEAIVDEKDAGVGSQLAPALEILKTLKEDSDLRQQAEEGGVTPQLLEGILERLPANAKAGLKNNDVAFYLTRLTLAGKLRREPGSLALYVSQP